MLTIALGTHVRTRDGHDLGKVERLILDPATRVPRALVVHKGLLLHHDVEIPLTAVAGDPDGRGLRLEHTAAEARELPEFDPTRYGRPPLDYVTPPIYGAEDLLWPLDADPWATVKNPPEGLVLDEGTDVVAHDGVPLGVIRAVTLDPATRQPRRFVLQRGLLHRQQYDLPADVVAAVEDGRVRLAIGKADLEPYRVARAA